MSETAAAFINGAELKASADLERMELVAFAHPSPDRVEFTYVDPDKCDAHCLPEIVKRFVLNLLTEKVALYTSVVTEIPGHGPATMCAVLVPPDNGTVMADALGE